MDPSVLSASLEKAFPGMALRTDLPWSALTTLGLGNAAPVLAEPDDETRLAELIAFLRAENIPFFLLGGGSNVVGTDDESAAVVAVRLGKGFSTLSVDGTVADAGAPLSLGRFVSTMAERGLGGLAPLAGIPGTLGGAVAMNAGADGVEIGRFVKSLRGVLPDGMRWSVSGDEVEWRYRGAMLPDGVAVTGVSLSLEPVDPREELEGIAAARAARKARFPRGRSAGCAFKNPFPELPAGKALDIAGCKGLSRGGAEVSAEHANFILNAGGASEADFAGLMAEARGRVLERLGVALEPEVRFVSASTRAKLEDLLKTPEILLLKGGESSERGVSLLSGAAVEKALETAGFAVEGVDVSTLENAAAAIERAISRRGSESAPLVVFPVLHGGYGEDGRIQAVMEEKGVPFVGAGSKGCAMAMDKAVSKKTMEEAGIPTPRHAVVSKTDGTEIPLGLELPLVVKPAREGSSVGMAIVYSPDEWAEALAAAFEFDDAVVAEEFVEGAEITVGVVDGEVLPAVEIRYPGKIYDYDAKYVHGKGETLYFCPPESLSETVLKRAAETALAFAEAIESTALTRVDMMVPGDDVLVLEANNIPGFTSHSLLPKAAAVAGYPFPSLCGKLAMAALNRGAVTMRG